MITWVEALPLSSSQQPPCALSPHPHPPPADCGSHQGHHGFTSLVLALLSGILPWWLLCEACFVSESRHRGHTDRRLALSYCCAVLSCINPARCPQSSALGRWSEADGSQLSAAQLLWAVVLGGSACACVCCVCAQARGCRRTRQTRCGLCAGCPGEATGGDAYSADPSSSAAVT